MMHHRAIENDENRRRKLRGVQTLEALLALAILLIASLGTLQIGLTMRVYQTVAAAAHVGAKAAARAASLEEIGADVSSFLKRNGIPNHEELCVVVQKSDQARRPLQLGFVKLQNNDELMPNEVRVVVRLTANGARLPNVLASLGLDLANRQFEASAVTTVWRS